ncbi:MAG TPA: methyltransferase domain-containing protein [Planctomycetota bacterium]|nr:methyltransferase domain-containing protein [Planctomycetota bacterium]
MLETRSHASEVLDDFALEGAEVEAALTSIERVNRWLGGTRVLLDGFERLAALPELARLERPLVVHDLGCGGGDGLRALADWGRRRGRALELCGLDASSAALRLARDRSRGHPQVEYRQRDFLARDYTPDGVDVVTLNLCMHHLEDAQIFELLARCRRAGVRAVLVNDLHRHALAYRLFGLLCRLTAAPRIAREDGLLSVAKGFRRSELEHHARAAGARLELRWRWAFRYQALLCFPVPRAPGAANCAG